MRYTVEPSPLWGFYVYRVEHIRSFLSTHAVKYAVQWYYDQKDAIKYANRMNKEQP